MNWKILSTIWNVISIALWILALIFHKAIADFIFQFINNSIVLNFYDLFKTLSILFYALLIILNIVSSFLTVKAENQKAMLWLIGITYAQFLLFVGLIILFALLFLASYFL